MEFELTLLPLLIYGGLFLLALIVGICGLMMRRKWQSIEVIVLFGFWFLGSLVGYAIVRLLHDLLNSGAIGSVATFTLLFAPIVVGPVIFVLIAKLLLDFVLPSSDSRTRSEY